MNWACCLACHEKAADDGWFDELPFNVLQEGRQTGGCLKSHERVVEEPPESKVWAVQNAADKKLCEVPNIALAWKSTRGRSTHHPRRECIRAGRSRRDPQGDDTGCRFFLQRARGLCLDSASEIREILSQAAIGGEHQKTGAHPQKSQSARSMGCCWSQVTGAL